jgi:3-deoxy-D-manno-octulosonic acid hydroxylase-like protein
VNNLPWTAVDDYRRETGWVRPEEKEARSRHYCESLESGQILLFPELPFALPAEDQEFLLRQEWAELRLHKNVSYRPSEDVLKGVSGSAATTDRLRSIFRNYAAAVIDFAGKFLSPYAGKWTIDFSSFRPFAEERRGLPLHKRNDLLHVDAFPSRPTHGGRILRIFTNLNPKQARVWHTTDPFRSLAERYAEQAGLLRFAEQSWVSRTVEDLGAKLGFRPAGRTPYDMFMLSFHDYLKENTDFQKGCRKIRLEFPPLSTWLVLTDGVAHAVMSGQYALEQTFLLEPEALVVPDEAPYRILERIAGQPLVS